MGSWGQYAKEHEAKLRNARRVAEETDISTISPLEAYDITKKYIPNLLGKKEHQLFPDHFFFDEVMTPRQEELCSQLVDLWFKGFVPLAEIYKHEQSNRKIDHSRKKLQELDKLLEHKAIEQPDAYTTESLKNPVSPEAHNQARGLLTGFWPLMNAVEAEGTEAQKREADKIKTEVIYVLGRDRSATASSGWQL